MKNNHHHSHKSGQEKVQEQGGNHKEHLEKKALHAHKKAMPHNEHVGHDGHNHHQMMIEDFKRRFWITLVLALPVIVLSPMIQEIFGYSLGVPYQMWISFVLSSIIFFYGGRPFLTGLVEEIKKGSPGMMTLIGVAITVAYLYSTATVLGLEGMDFFWELATLIVVMLLGHWIETADIILVNSNPKDIASLVLFGRATYKKWSRTLFGQRPIMLLPYRWPRV